MRGTINPHKKTKNPHNNKKEINRLGRRKKGPSAQMGNSEARLTYELTKARGKDQSREKGVDQRNLA